MERGESGGAMVEFDEFGNYIGAEPDSGSDSETSDAEDAPGDARDSRGRDEEEDDDHDNGTNDGNPPGQAQGPSRQITLHEDKQYYPEPEEVYGPHTEVRFEEEDEQPIEDPIVKPVLSKSLWLPEPSNSMPSCLYNEAYLASLHSNPSLSRSVAVAGHLHHGKTSLLDLCVERVHVVDRRSRARELQMRYTDPRVDELDRLVSIKASVMSLLLPNRRGKQLAFSMYDAPGHPDFVDEATATMRACDGCLLVVDAAEGVMSGTRRHARLAARDGLEICLVINKVDRLITELRLPPADAYHKLKALVDDLEDMMQASVAGNQQQQQHEKRKHAERFVDPAGKGNVCFASAKHGWSFSLRTFADAVHGDSVDGDALANRLWGDIWLDPSTRGFKRSPPDGVSKSYRTFVQFVLEPLYKIYSQAVGEHPVQIENMLAKLGASLTDEEKKLDAEPLARLCVQRCITPDTSLGLVDCMERGLPTAEKALHRKLVLTWRGPEPPSAIGDQDGPLLAHVVRVHTAHDAGSFESVVRIFSGTLHSGEKVKVLGETYSADEDEEDCAVASISQVKLLCSRYSVGLEYATSGMLVAVKGVEQGVSKTATIVRPGGAGSVEHPFKPLQFDCTPTTKLAVEPLNPSELPKMVEGLRSVSRVYPLLQTKVEESGEHTLIGSGELYMDSVMKDLRQVYGEVEVKVADPVTVFRETVAETSSRMCKATSPNAKNVLSFVAEPLETGLPLAIEREEIRLDMSKKTVQIFFQERFGYDLLASRSVWAFGPQEQGPNLLLDDTLPSEVDKAQLASSARSPIVQGFQWGCSEGPIADEPVRGVKMKLVGASLAEARAMRAGGQLIPTARRGTYASLLTATPKLLEPILRAEVQCSADCLQAVHAVLKKRRGHALEEKPCEGTPVYVVAALLPAIESFGFETDLRYHTQGQAFPLTQFDHWDYVPGDPLDDSTVLRPLEPSAPNALARDFAVKTRRRKGLPDEISSSKYLEEDEEEKGNEEGEEVENGIAMER